MFTVVTNYVTAMITNYHGPKKFVVTEFDYFVIFSRLRRKISKTDKLKRMIERKVGRKLNLETDENDRVRIPLEIAQTYDINIDQ
jgi:hypothetical protein